MANITHYRGPEIIWEAGYQGESIDKTDVSTAVTPTESLKYIQTMNVRSNENVEDAKFINGGEGRNISTRTKGTHEARVDMSFWIAKDMNQTDMQEGYFLKMAIDGTGTDSSNLYTIPATTNEYGSDYLKVMTIETGYNKSGSITAHKITGAIVNGETMHLEMGQKCLWTWDMRAVKAEKVTSFSGGSVAESTEQPFLWGDVKMSLDDAGAGPTTLDGVEMFEHIIDNQITPVLDLANATSTRFPTYWELGTRRIRGSFRVKLTTATHNGQDLWEDLYNDSTGTATPTEGVLLKDINIRLYIDGTYYVDYTYHDVTYLDIADELKGEGVGVVTVPWSAIALVLVVKAHTSATEPTNWA